MRHAEDGRWYVIVMIKISYNMTMLHTFHGLGPADKWRTGVRGAMTTAEIINLTVIKVREKCIFQRSQFKDCIL
jgi:hypothetical protein